MPKPHGIASGRYMEHGKQPQMFHSLSCITTTAMINKNMKIK
ncbi:hypothetical protein B4168_2557 [Anoxybacillus flavithermus]|nr:hypothetical protein B4168_2557 [Anoxybacillus flavithermus]OAO85223.1 hypothetical protein GT23_2914 [Parageobacillus thermoglucosidasius]